MQLYKMTPGDIREWKAYQQVGKQNLALIRLQKRADKHLGEETSQAKLVEFKGADGKEYVVPC